MNNNDKAELLKETIAHLYSNEGRSFSYMERLLKIPRSVISKKIREWDLKPAEPTHHMSPSTEKFYKRNKDKIIALLKNGVTASEIARRLRFNRRLFQTYCLNDPQFKEIYQQYIRKGTGNTSLPSMNSFQNRRYSPELDLPDEEWKTILGWPDYKVSNMGRVIHYNNVVDDYIFISASPNINTGRLYVRLVDGSRNANLMLHRLVAFAFVDGYSDVNNTVNHKDGDITNNKASNLEWVSQSENNTHAYRVLHRVKNRYTGPKFSKIIYQNKYEFKTVAALARFLKKSETQVRRYLEKPEQHDLEIVM